MKFWIVTPSFNQLEWLKLCVASVRDQVAPDGNEVDGCSLMVDRECAKRSSKADGAKNRLNEPILVRHHIQDAQSTDGTAEWLAEYIAHQPSTNNYQLSFASEADEGMYDAINRGWKLAPDDVNVIAHLNCDEQYLPGALRIIADFMKSHPKTDIVLADMIVIDADGSYICHRRSLKPFAVFSRYCCGGSTAATFQRASVTQEKKVFFDTRWRNLGDKVWYNMLHRARCRFAVCHQIVSVFTETGENLNWTEEGRTEKRRYEEEFLKGRGFGANLVSLLNGIRRYVKEFSIESPHEFSIYRPAAEHRIATRIKSPRGVWHKKWSAS